jgi:hypothetical protein
LFGFGHNLNRAAIVEDKKIAGAQPYGRGISNLDPRSLDACEFAARCLPLLERQD